MDRSAWEVWRAQQCESRVECVCERGYSAFSLLLEPASLFFVAYGALYYSRSELQAKLYIGSVIG